MKYNAAHSGLISCVLIVTVISGCKADVSTSSAGQKSSNSQQVAPDKSAIIETDNAKVEVAPNTFAYEVIISLMSPSELFADEKVKFISPTVRVRVQDVNGTPVPPADFKDNIKISINLLEEASGSKDFVLGLVSPDNFARKIFVPNNKVNVRPKIVTIDSRSSDAAYIAARPLSGFTSAPYEELENTYTPSGIDTAQTSADTPKPDPIPAAPSKDDGENLIVVPPNPVVPNTPGNVSLVRASGKVTLTFAHDASANAGVLIARRTGSAVTWTPANGTEYNIAQDLGSGQSVVYKGAGTTFEDTGLTNSTTYHYRIFSISNDNYYSIGVAGSSTPGIPLPPGPVRNLHAITALDGMVTLNWTAAARANSYTVFRATTKSTINTITDLPFKTGITAITLSDVEVSNGTRYYYVVTAVNQDGDGSASFEMTAKPWDPTAAAADNFLFVNAAFTGTPDGSFAAPYTTISAAVAHPVFSGGTIVIFDGTYNQAAAVMVTLPVTIRSRSGHHSTSNVVLDGQGTSHSGFSIATNIDDVTIQGLEFKAYITSSDSLGAVSPATGADNVSVIYNYLKDNRTGLLARSNSGWTANNWLVLGNEVDDNTGVVNSQDCMHVYATNNMRIIDNVLANCDYYGINALDATNLLIKGNHISGTKYAGIALGDFMLVSGNITIEENIITNVNTAVSADSGGIRVKAVTGTQFNIRKNTISATNTSINFSSAIDVSQFKIDQNNLFANSSGNYITTIGTTVLDITDNWWGDATGPYDLTENPAGNVAITFSGSVDPFPFSQTAIPAPE